ncbi:MAG: glycosyltransferase [Rubricoccaceae bacterium]|nr:glycosyltransferase [Rubricoccaceae bacterium]
MPLKVVITADPFLPVPPRHYGGIERIIDLLVRGLVDRGHDVTLICHSDSEVPCAVVRYPRIPLDSPLSAFRHACCVTAAIMGKGYDIVHNFGRLAYLTCLLPFSPPILMTYQRRITPRAVVMATRLSRGNLTLCAVSERMVSGLRYLGDWHVVYNAVPERIFEPRNEFDANAPLLFLGRIEHIKGTHLAIEVASRSRRRLIIAGNVPESEEHRRYFRERISPAIDGEHISYIGPVDDKAKAKLLQRGAALLMPILWDEPFGIVMAEALACGTPVIGLNRGSVPEVVDHGITGFVCDSTAEMVTAVSRLEEIDRTKCRHSMESRFSAKVLVDSYESIYRRMLSKRDPALVGKHG